MNQLENNATRAILKEAFERDKAGGGLRQKAIKNKRFFPAAYILWFYKVQAVG